MLVVDGNNSMKRMAEYGGHVTGDMRVFDEGDYFLPCSFVDRFAHEVKSARPSAQPSPQTTVHDLVDEAIPSLSNGDEDEESYLSAHCTKNWKAAAADDKKMWGAFDETGIFACACCHGLIVWIVDMIKSGEL
jgi:hypothetical protein